MKPIGAITAVGIFFTALAVTAGDNMKAFPPPEDGQTRFVLELSPQNDESLLKVELIVGKTVEIDDVNQYLFGGTIQQETIAGWGFTRYVVDALGPMAGTLMAVDPDAPKVRRFIRLGGDPYLIRYNSRLPVVVYGPADAEVRYRIWRTVPDLDVMQEG